MAQNTIGSTMQQSRSAVSTANLWLGCLLLLAAFALSSFLPSRAFAGGYEFPAGSPRALGRGATGLARADDPIMAFLNPAALGSMQTQLLLGTHFSFQKACVDRTGNYDGSYVGGTPGTDSGVPHPNQCNGEQPRDRFTLMPVIAGTFRLHKRVGMAVGLEPPYATREMNWQTNTRPDAQGNEIPGFIKAPPGANTSDGLVPSPLRYMLVADNVVVLYPTIAIGAKLTDWLQIGVGFSTGFAHIKFTNYTRYTEEGEAYYDSSTGANDVPTSVRVFDWFIPRVIGSVHAIPHDSVDIMAGFRWEDSIKADGTTKALPFVFGDAQRNLTKGNVRYTAPRPLWITFGIRYADRITPRPKLDDAVGKSDATDDPMKNERFDIEADVIYERNSVVDDHLFASGDLGVFVNPDDADPVLTIPEFASPIQIPHRWKDQISLRLGGDWNVMPGKLALRLGTSYETEGFRDGYGYIDYFPMQRFGAHAGLSGRIGTIEMTLGYAHYFQTDFNNPNGQSQQIVIDLSGPVAATHTPINSGTYTGHIDVLSWSLRVLFD